jgi:streptogramin lyase/putative copper export protein/methionine-rich copper-binding protein CopC
VNGVRVELLALFTIVTILLVAGPLAPVYAHANLIRSDPAANSILPTPPHQVTLYFTEQLEPKLSGAAVYDSNGKEVDMGYSVSPTGATILIVSLPTLPSGVYTVSWYAISAVDGHHTSGSFSFGVGNVTIPVQNSTNQAYTFPSALEVVERWLNLLGDVMFLGGSVFVLSIWNPTLSSMGGARLDDYGTKVLRRVRKMLRLFAVVAIGATILLLVVEAIAAAASPSLSDISAAAYTILTSTRLGEYWLFRLAVVLVAAGASAILLQQKNPLRRSWILIMAIGLVLSLSTSITSHNAAATEYDPTINLLSDWIHLVAVGAWVGGLSYLAIAITSLSGLMKQRGKTVAELLRRFSSVAVVCVGAIGITGIYNLVLEVGSFTLLLTTAYGKILLLKLAIFAPMVAFGALNQFVLFDHIVDANSKRSQTKKRETVRWVGRFRLSIRTEMTFGIILLLVVGLLTASAPVAQAPSSAPQYQPVPFVIRGYSTGGVNVTLKIFPFQAGVNHFEIDFTDQQGTPVSTIRSAFLKFQYLERNIGVSIANATASPNQGEYALDGTYLSFSGNWRAEVWAQRTGGFDVVVPFLLDVPAISLRFSELPLSSDANPYGITVDQNGTVWFAETGSGSLARYDPTTGTFTEFSLPQSGTRPFYLAIDNNSAVWATETQYNQIVMFNPSTDTFKQYSVPTSGAVPGGITVDRNGYVWFTEELADKIGRLNPATGNITEFQIPTQDAIPIQIAVGARGVLWFTESKACKIGMVNSESGVITEFQPQNRTLLGPTGITVSPDGSVWFTEHAGNRITEFHATNQTFQSYTIPTPQAFPFGIAFHANRVWFVEHIANAIGSLDLGTGTFSNFPVPNNSSDVQLLSVDQGGNVWFTLPASNVLGVLTSTTSPLQLTSISNNSSFTQLALVAAIVIAASSIVAFVVGRKRMERKADVRRPVSRSRR